MQPTLKIYDTDSHLTVCDATVLACSFDEARNAYGIILDQTVFFPEGGGQFADTGSLCGSVTAQVSDVQIKDEIITHYTDTALPVGERVTCQIDWTRRFDFMQQHSAEHIISGLVYRNFGYHNVGFHLGLEETTLDFDGPLTAGQLTWLEQEANQAIWKNITFEISYPDAAALAAMDYRSKKELTGAVRIVTVPGYDVCACCAPHVYLSGEIGFLKITNAMAHRGGMRLTILCGMRALSDYRQKQANVEEISALLSAKQPLVANAVRKAKDDQLILTQRINELQKKVLEAELRALPAPDSTENVCIFQSDLDTKAIRDAVNTLCTQYKGFCGIFVGSDTDGYRFVVGSAAKDCRILAEALKASYAAKSGGSAKMIQGSLAVDAASLQAFLQTF